MSTKKFTVIYMDRKVGVLSKSSYSEFLIKCTQKFAISKCDGITLTLEDETEVDEEYFAELDSGQVLRIVSGSAASELKGSAASRTLVFMLEEFVTRCIENKPSLRDKVQDLLRKGALPDLATLVETLKGEGELVTRCSQRQYHPSWFVGLSPSLSRKEDALRASAESRVRAYFSQLQKCLRAAVTSSEPKNIAKSADHLRQDTEACLGYMKDRLKAGDFQRGYFDRSLACSLGRLCDEEGLFRCNGEFNAPACPSSHSINPYASREMRVVFSTWNLDHMVEKSRSVIPRLAEALASIPLPQINLPYFYDLLFSRHLASIDTLLSRPLATSDVMESVAGGVANNRMDIKSSMKRSLSEDFDDVDGNSKSKIDKSTPDDTSFPKKRQRYSKISVVNGFEDNSECDVVGNIRRGEALHKKWETSVSQNVEKNGRINESPNASTNALQCNFINTISQKSRCDSKYQQVEKIKRKLVEPQNNLDEIQSGDVAIGSNEISHDDGLEHLKSDEDVPNNSADRRLSLKGGCKLLCPPSWNGNLKLVHIACHIKLPHHLLCQEELVTATPGSESLPPVDRCCVRHTGRTTTIGRAAIRGAAASRQGSIERPLNRSNNY